MGKNHWRDRERGKLSKVNNGGRERKKQAASTWGRRRLFIASPKNVTVMCRNRTQRYYRWRSGTTAGWHPGGTQGTTAPSGCGTSERHRCTPGERYYRWAAGTTAGPLRINPKGHSGRTWLLPPGYRRDNSTQKGSSGTSGGTTSGSSAD